MIGRVGGPKWVSATKRKTRGEAVVAFADDIGRKLADQNNRVVRFKAKSGLDNRP